MFFIFSSTLVLTSSIDVVFILSMGRVQVIIAPLKAYSSFKRGTTRDFYPAALCMKRMESKLWQSTYSSTVVKISISAWYHIFVHFQTYLKTLARTHMWNISSTCMFKHICAKNWVVWQMSIQHIERRIASEMYLKIIAFNCNGSQTFTSRSPSPKAVPSNEQSLSCSHLHNW